MEDLGCFTDRNIPTAKDRVVPDDEASLLNEEPGANGVMLDLSQVGSKRKKQTITAIDYFNQFLCASDYPARDHSQVTAEMLTQKLFGQFAFFLTMKCESLWFQTCHNYLSCVKCHFENQPRFKDHHVFSGKQQWYRRLRGNIALSFMKLCQETGKPLVKDTTACSREDLISLTKELFLGNDLKSTELRDLVIKQFHCIGRVSEPASLQMNSLTWNTNGSCLHMGYYATKTAQESKCNLVVDRTEWASCPIHSTACTLATRKAPIPESGGKPYYSTIPLGSSVSSTLNKVLVALDVNFTSHGLKHGATQHCGHNGNLQWHWIGARAGSMLSLVGKMFVYLKESEANDVKVARALSGWEDNGRFRGGILPTLSENYLILHPKLVPMMNTVFSLVLENFSSEFVLGLFSSLLMHFESMKLFEDRNNMHSDVFFTLVNAAALCGLSVDDLLHHSNHLQREFRHMNLMALPPACQVNERGEMVLPNNAVDMKSLYSYLEDTITVSNDVLKESHEVSSQCQSLDVRMSKLESSVAEIKAMCSQILTVVDPERVIAPLAPPRPANEIAVQYPFRGSLKGVSVESVFVDWFRFKVYSIPVPADKRTQNNNSSIRMVVAYLCLLTAEGRHVTTVPDVTSAEYSDWVDGIRELARGAVSTALEILLQDKLLGWTKPNPPKPPVATVPSFHKGILAASKRAHLNGFLPRFLNTLCDQATPLLLRVDTPVLATDRAGRTGDVYTFQHRQQVEARANIE